MPDEEPCFTLEEPPPKLRYAIQKKPSTKQNLMCQMAVNLHNRVESLGPNQIGQAKRDEELTDIVHTFSVGGVQPGGNVQHAIDHLQSMQKRLFRTYFSPQLNLARMHFLRKAVLATVMGAAVGLILSRVVQWPEVANYIYLMVASALGVALVSASTGHHHDFDAFDDDLASLDAPFTKLFIAAGIALVIALLLSTDAATLKLGTMSTNAIGKDTTVALALGAIFGVASRDALRLLVRFGTQAITKLSGGAQNQHSR